MPTNLIRRHNLLTLFAEYVSQRQQADPSISISGLDRAFAAKLQIANSSFSSMKSGSRPIGIKIARQIEVACSKPPGWLDETHTDEGDASIGDDKELSKFIKLATRAFKHSDESGRNQLNAWMRQSLAGQ